MYVVVYAITADNRPLVVGRQGTVDELIDILAERYPDAIIVGIEEHPDR